MKKFFLLPLVAASLLSACASTDTTSSSREPVADREYPTGSNIPRRASNSGSQSGVSNSDRDAADAVRGGVTLPQMGPSMPKAQ